MSEQTIIHGDCLDKMSEIETGLVDLVITSPPYNVGLDYDEYNDAKTIDEYRSFLRSVFVELDRVVNSEGRVCINIALKNDSGIVDLPFLIKNLADGVGWEQRFEIIWNKGQSEGSSAWGSWRSPSSPRPIFNHEYILIFDVGSKKSRSEKVIDKEDFMDIVKSVWSIKPDSNSEHPAPFPKEISERLILLNSYEGDVVLDPFLGSGTTLVSCKKMDREGIGIELSENYADMAQERVDDFTPPDERKFEFMT